MAGVTKRPKIKRRPHRLKIKTTTPEGKPVKSPFVRDGNGIIIDCPRCASIGVSVVSARDGLTPSSPRLAELYCKACHHEWVSEVEHAR